MEKRQIDIGERGLSLRNFDDMFRFCDVFVKSGLAPDGDTQAKVMIKLQAGLELGFQPMQALQTLIVTDKGRLSMMAVGMLALIRRSPLCDWADVTVKGIGDERVAVFSFQRRGTPERSVTFSVDDAKTARLWNKKTQKGHDTTWVTSPEDMLIARAISRGAKRYWSDVLLGVEAQEVMQDVDGFSPTPATGPVRGATTVSQPSVLTGPVGNDPIFDAVEATAPDGPIDIPMDPEPEPKVDENGEVIE